MNILILGAGGAGISAAQAIRSIDESIDIEMISVEDCMPYAICGLPDYLSGKFSLKTLKRLDSHFFTTNKIKLILGKEAVKVDPLKKTVQVKDISTNKIGEKIAFDKLLIATGSEPIIPDVPGLDKKQLYIVSNLNSIKRIIVGLKKAKRVAVIGGGFVGIECAQALKRRKKDVIVIESVDHILSNMFDAELSCIAQEMLEKQGITFILGNQVRELTGNAVVKGLKHDTGTIECDMVLVSVGFKPSTDIVGDTKIRVSQGILVNEFMESNIKGIFAAGDIAESFDCIHRQPGLKTTWQNAVEQGHVAGLNMAGKKITYPGFQSYNIVNINSVPFLSMGNVTNLPHDCVHLVSRGPNSMRKVFIQNDTILGLECYGDMTNSGHLFSLINKAANVKQYHSKILSYYFHDDWKGT